uniref:Uncharacterized protein n=1 Tax=Vombatus ursinus TaxID=29139 RepID=A0A4X2K544_VOMUR
ITYNLLHIDQFIIFMGISNTHLNLESISSSGFASFHTASISKVFDGAKIMCTINLCLLFSFGSYSQKTVALLKQVQSTLNQ